MSCEVVEIDNHTLRAETRDVVERRPYHDSRPRVFNTTYTLVAQPPSQYGDMMLFSQWIVNNYVAKQDCWSLCKYVNICCMNGITILLYSLVDSLETIHLDFNRPVNARTVNDMFTFEHNVNVFYMDLIGMVHVQNNVILNQLNKIKQEQETKKVKHLDPCSLCCLADDCIDDDSLTSDTE